MLTRRRFIAISAALAPSLTLASPIEPYVETSIALGAEVTLHLQHPDAPRLAAIAMAEIQRLEAVFSLYQPNAVLARLNRESVFESPPFELLECLGTARAVNLASGGRFDPTVQPLWSAYRIATERGKPLTEAERQRAFGYSGWRGVTVSPDRVTLRPGMAMTLNGIAQGYIADRVAALLTNHGLSRALIDTGEMVALPEGSWSLELADRDMKLQNRALATSAPLGMTFGGDGHTSHILDPLTGRPAVARWRAVSISATQAALADALSTAACLMESREEIVTLCEQFAGATLETALPI